MKYCLDCAELKSKCKCNSIYQSGIHTYAQSIISLINPSSTGIPISSKEIIVILTGPVFDLWMGIKVRIPILNSSYITHREKVFQFNVNKEKLYKIWPEPRFAYDLHINVGTNNNVEKCRFVDHFAYGRGEV